MANELAVQNETDPMIIGQIRLSKSRGSKMASFIIAWHLDVRTL
jgi:hypothetical protein